MIFNISDKKR